LAKRGSIELRDERLAGEDELKGGKYGNDVTVLHEYWFIPDEQAENREHERHGSAY
jgi:hypothetical protein